MPKIKLDSPKYQEWNQANKTTRIENDLSTLKSILNETQVTRYREHLEAEPAR